ncbi:MAG: hydantoinase B/oxoprolinase family protein [Betaproteobacteria bacterium]|nr:hydantoinase B/oxoprolinase family protein [Betaproteobacteria bacterium]
MKLDSVLTQILWNRVISVADEAATGLIRTSYSSVVRDFNDFACGLFDVKGNLLAHSTKTTTAFIGVMPYVMRDFLQHFSADALEPGDALITNDPWQGTGHAYDLCIASPIFHRDRIVAYAICIVHHLDVGGRFGTTESKDMYEEGLRLPMLKLYRGGVFDKSIQHIIRENVRAPDKMFGDIRAQIVANNVCGKGLIGMLEDYGLDAGSLHDLSQEISARSERSLRAKIAEVPDGTYENEVTLPTIGSVSGIGIKVALTVAGDSIVIDYAGSSGEVSVAVNTTFNMTRSYSMYPIKLALDPSVPNNEGSFRPVTVRAPEGSLLNCKPPAPTWGRTMVCHNLPEIVFGALAKALPGRIMAGSGSTPLVFTYIRAKRKNGRTHVGIASSMGGLGANARTDGPSCRGFPYNVGNIAIETTENDLPIIYLKKELMPNSGGPGRNRGGLGQEFEFVVADGDLGPDGPMLVGIRGSGRKPESPYPVFGRLGGGVGRGEHLALNGVEIPNGPQQALGPGDRLSMALPGGGGFGNPFEREPERVAHDVALGYVTPQGALDDYGVSVDASGKVDMIETGRKRGVNKGP